MNLSKEEIESGLANLKYKPIENAPAPTGDIPHATHEGVLQLGKHKIRAYILNTGDRVFDADDMEPFLKEFLGEDFKYIQQDFTKLQFDGEIK